MARPTDPSELLRPISTSSRRAKSFPDLGGPHYAQVIAGLEGGVIERSSAVLIPQRAGATRRKTWFADLAERVDSLVITRRTVSDESVAGSRSSSDRLAGTQVIGDIPAVRSDNLGAARELAEHLIGHGRRASSFVGDPARSPDVGDRWVHDVLTRHGLAGDAALVTCGGFEHDHGCKADVRLFTDAPDVDAIVCANDEIASAAQLFTHMTVDTTEGALLPTSVVVRSSSECVEDEST